MEIVWLAFFDGENNEIFPSIFEIASQFFLFFIFNRKSSFLLKQTFPKVFFMNYKFDFLRSPGFTDNRFFLLTTFFKNAEFCMPWSVSDILTFKFKK